MLQINSYSLGQRTGLVMRHTKRASRIIGLAFCLSVILFIAGFAAYRFSTDKEKQLANYGLIIPGNDRTFAEGIARGYKLLVESYVSSISPKILYQAAKETIELIEQNWLPEEKALNKEALDTLIQWQQEAESSPNSSQDGNENNGANAKSDGVRAPKRVILSEEQQIKQEQLFAAEYKKYSAKSLKQIYEDALANSRLQGFYSQEFAKKLYTEALAALCRPLNDPFSGFYQKSSFYELSDTTNGSFGGVGIYISKQPIRQVFGLSEEKPSDGQTTEEAKQNSEIEQETKHSYQYLQKHYIKVSRPFPGGPSFRAGIMADDFIYAIDGEHAKDWEVEQVQNTVRGAPGSKVKITVLRARQHKIDFEVVREKIEIVAINSATIPLPKKVDNTEKNGAKILYVELSQFNAVAGMQFKEQMKQFFHKQMNDKDKEPIVALLLDMRNNPGGLLSVAVDVADQFLSGGLLVTTDARTSENILKFEAKERITIPEDIPVYVMVNSGSASAAEIVAGALQDNHRAQVLGEKSFGKGSVQIPVTLPEGILKLTIAHFYTPKGVNLANNGIQPDHEFHVTALSEQELAELGKLWQASLIPSFVSQNRNFTDEEFLAFFEKEIKEQYKIQEKTAKRLAYSEKMRYMEKLPVYNLEYDSILRDAVDYISASVAVSAE